MAYSSVIIFTTLESNFLKTLFNKLYGFYIPMDVDSYILSNNITKTLNIFKKEEYYVLLSALLNIKYISTSNFTDNECNLITNKIDDISEVIMRIWHNPYNFYITSNITYTKLMSEYYDIIYSTYIEI